MFPFSAQDRAAAVGAFRPDSRRTLSKGQALQVYERAAKSVRDSESLYGGPATNVLLKAADLGTCSSIFEFGCGAGQLAERILGDEQSTAASREYLAIDISPNMVAEASARLSRFGRMDAFISTYVFDLLSDAEIANALTLAWRLLKPNGKLCLSGLTYGKGPLGWAATGVWEGIHWAFPEVVGGCRCQMLLPYLGPGWALDTDVTVAGGLLSSQVLVARKQPDQALF